MKHVIKIFLFIIVLTLFLSCNRQYTTGLEMRYGMTTEPATLDPLNPAGTADGYSILFNVFDGLVKPDTEGLMKLCLAESLKIEELGQEYIFTLKQNVIFHDGSALTVDDVKFSLDTAAAAGFTGLDLIERIETSEDTVRIVLKSPDTEFLPYLYIGIVQAANTDREKNIIGTGPYFVENYNVQQSLVLKKFPGYWNENKPHLEKITIVFFPDSNSLIPGLYGGGIDITSLTGNLASQLDQNRFDIMPDYSSMVQLLALNNAVPPLNDIRVRKAINYGIDIQGIIDSAFFGLGEPSGSPVIPGLKAYYEQSLADPYPFDREKAISLLSEAGFGEDGQKLSLEITVPSNYTMHIDTAQVIASQLENIGINVTIKLVEWAVWLSDVYHGRNYQSTIISVHSPTVSPRGFLFRYRSADENNFINFSSLDFDRIYDKILAETDEAERIKLYKEAQLIISDNAASVFIQDILGFSAFRAGAYTGILSYPLNVIDFAAIYEIANISLDRQ